MKPLLLCSAAIVALSSCAPTIPDSGSGVGFGSYEEYEARQAARDAALTGTALPAPDAVDVSSLDSGSTTASAAGDDAASVAAQTREALRASADAEQAALNSGRPVVHASPGNPPPPPASHAGISDENDFEAVGSRRSIESDAERMARIRQQYEVAAVEALPGRTDSGPNIVQYALSTNHPVGTQVYRRIGLNKESKFLRNCAQYPSPDMAQIDFLEKGGPDRDKLGLDPDGDGYACGWDPAPFRKVKG